MKSLVFFPVCAVVMALLSPLVAAADTGLDFKEGDRAVLLGGTFIERDVQFGYLETALTVAFADRSVTFRNLAWSGDTVWADSRGIFDPPAVGYRRLLELTKELQPTVILLAYGQNEAFAGAAGLPAFLQQYEQLARDLTTSTGARLVFLLPQYVHRSGAAYERLNAGLQVYREGIQELARRLNAGLFDLESPEQQSAAAVTAAPAGDYEGMHLTATGYQHLATAVSARLGSSPVNFAAPKIEALRQQIVEKNTLFFHRWRPQNTTYLLGFRKHEQGNNAVELPRFDELTKAADDEIAGQRKGL